MCVCVCGGGVISAYLISWIVVAECVCVCGGGGDQCLSDLSDCGGTVCVCVWGGGDQCLSDLLDCGGTGVCVCVGGGVISAYLISSGDGCSICSAEVTSTYSIWPGDCCRSILCLRTSNQEPTYYIGYDDRYRLCGCGSNQYLSHLFS